MIYPLLLLVSDFVALLSAFTLAYILRVQIDNAPLVREIEAISFIQVLFILFPIWLLINAMLGLYTRPVYEKRLPELGRLITAAFIGILVIIGYDFLREETIFPARLVPVYGLFLSFFFLTTFRNILWILRRFMFRYGYGVRGVMIIGSTPATKKLFDSLKNTLNSGYKIRAIVGDKSMLPKDYDGKHYSTIEAALKALPKMAIHTIIQTEFYDNENRNNQIFSTVRDNHLQYKFIPAQSDFYTGKNTVEVLFGFPVISVHQTPLVGWGRIIKRITDLVFTTIAMVIALPLMLLVAIISKITEPSAPVIYVQRRVTRFGTGFGIYKFRSMQWKWQTGPNAPYKDNEASFKAMGREDLIPELRKYSKVKKDPRVTPLGKFLRSTSLDELPQLFNVLKGDISLVGPRPMTVEEAKEFRKQSDGDVILSVKGGVTGLWQVSGRSDISFEERVNLELYYVQNWSFLLDIKILFKTIWVVLFRKGAG